VTDQAAEETAIYEEEVPRSTIGYAVGGVLVLVLVLGAATRYLSVHVPKWGATTSFEGIAKSIEFPV
jgi:hypothetical protein